MRLWGGWPRSRIFFAVDFVFALCSPLCYDLRFIEGILPMRANFFGNGHCFPKDIPRVHKVGQDSVPIAFGKFEEIRQRGHDRLPHQHSSRER
jgi:hypothetical protein